MSEPTIPPPNEADLKTDRFKAYRCCALLPAPGGEVVASFIRLLHAAESQLAAIRDLLTPLLGTEVCTARGSHHDDTCVGCRVQCSNAQFTEDCRACNGTGRRNIADRLSVVACVKMALNKEAK